MNNIFNNLFLTIDFEKLSKSNYWLSLSPYEDSGFWQEIILFVIFLSIITVYIFIRYKNTQFDSLKKIRKGILKSSIFFVIFMLLWVFMRTQGIYLLSNRLIGLSIVIFWLLWIGWILYYRIRKFPLEYFQELDKKRKEKYLPRSKK